MSQMFLYGVVNASPDSLNTDSIVEGPEQALARARQLLADGADGIDLGGQGSTDAATVVPWEAEWERLREAIRSEKKSLISGARGRIISDSTTR